MPDADLLVTGAKLVATCDADSRELPGGWVAVTDGVISGVGSAADGPVAARHTVVAGRALVRDGVLTVPGVEDILVRHAAAAACIQGLGQDHLR